MRFRHKPNWRLVLVIPLVFIVFVGIAFIYGMNRVGSVPSWPDLATTEASSSSAESGTGPTVSDYRQAALETLRPFLELALALESGQPVRADAELAALASQAHVDLMAMTVPASEREAHLAIVLMVDQWRRAAGGSVLDGRRAADSLAGLMSDYPWISL